MEDFDLLAHYSGGEAIKLSEVLAYAEFEGMSKEYLADLLAYIPEMDAVRLEWLRDKAKAEQEANNT